MRCARELGAGDSAFLTAHLPRHARVDKAGLDGDDFDAARRGQHAQGAREGVDERLGGCVRDHVRWSIEPGYRTNNAL